jgi:5-methylcytosine-specific restriction protein B
VAATRLDKSAIDLAEFEGLYTEFNQAYLTTEEGREHLLSYFDLRRQGRANYEAIRSKVAEGHLDREDVLLKLLPWADTASNRERGAWIHVAPAIAGDVKNWFEGAGWTKPEDWPKIADAIVEFVRKCERDPRELASACAEFAAFSYTKGFQAGFLSPILNALHPEAFLIANSKSRTAINHFGKVNYSTKLTEYPKLNSVGLNLVQQLTPSMERIGPKEVPPSDVFDCFSHWLVSVKRFDFGGTGYWKIAPGENARLWDVWKRQGLVSIGWNDLGDLSGTDYEEFARRRDELLKIHPEWSKDGLEQVWTFLHIQEEDRVLANRGTQEVLGVGRVTGPYFFQPDTEYGHCLPVIWEDLQPRGVHKGGWRRTLIKLKRAEFEEITTSQVLEAPTEEIGPRSFDLLAALSQTSTAAFYQAHKDEFGRYVEGPIKVLMARVSQRLPLGIRDVMETESGVFARIPKNDYGRGGAWDFYWGAFYPKGAKRISSPQLFVSITRATLDFGFYMGEYGLEYRSRFRKRARENADELEKVLAPDAQRLGVKFGTQPRDTILSGGQASDGLKLRDWLLDVESGDYRASVTLTRQQVQMTGRAELEDRIAQTFQVVWPLVRLAMEEGPVSAVIPVEESERDTNPAYGLEDLLKDTGFDREAVESWKRAIERKGQVILYGPPGTGKTFVAERLAKHLIAGGDGFSDLVQFHPAYSYEDFMEGIRPYSVDGQLSYDLKPGRFLQFCAEARAVEGTCVLIVDEINRANLARVLGELMYLLEYRQNTIPLTSGSRFAVPANVVLIGTMNTADRSIALVDHALRRRFAFLRLKPNLDLLRKYHSSTGFDVEPLIGLLDHVNTAIADENYQLGITYFLDQDIRLNLPGIWQTEITPYLEEFFFDDKAKAEQFAWDKVRGKLGF